MQSKICPSCKEANNPIFLKCRRCGNDFVSHLLSKMPDNGLTSKPVVSGKISGGDKVLIFFSAASFLLYFLIFLLQCSSEKYLTQVRGTLIEGYIWIILGPIMILAMLLCVGAGISLSAKKQTKLGNTFIVLAVLIFLLPQFGYGLAIKLHFLAKKNHANTSSSTQLMKDIIKMKDSNKMYFGSLQEKELKEHRRVDLIKIIKSDETSYAEKKNALYYINDITDDLWPKIIEILKMILKNEPKYFDVYYGWPLEKIMQWKELKKYEIFNVLKNDAASLGLHQTIIAHIESFKNLNTDGYQAASKAAYETPKRSRMTAAQNFSEDLKNASRTKARYDQYSDLIKKGQYQQAIEGLERLLFDDRMQKEYGNRILSDLVDAYSSLQNWQKALYYQRKFLDTSLGLQSINEQVVKLWKLQTLYAKNGGGDQSLLAPTLAIQFDVIRHQVQGFAWYASETLNIRVAATYFYSHLHFNLAEHYFLKGIESLRERDSLEKPKKTADGSEWLFRQALRNIYVIQNAYDKALAQQDWLLAYTESNLYKNNQHTQEFALLQAQHDKEVIVYAKEKNLQSIDIIYEHLSQGPSFELQAPNWKTYNEKYQDLKDRQAEEILAKSTATQKQNQDYSLIDFDQIELANRILFKDVKKDAVQIDSWDLKIPNNLISDKIPVKNLWRLRAYLRACKYTPIAQSKGWVGLDGYAIELQAKNGIRFTILSANGFGRLILFKNQEKMGDYSIVTTDFLTVSESLFKGALLGEGEGREAEKVPGTKMGVAQPVPR